LEIRDGVIRYGQFRLRATPRIPPCALIPLVEFMDIAAREVPDWLGLARDDTLRVLSPDDVAAYEARTGFGVWRFFAWEDSLCVVQPVPVLVARTLVGHAAYRLVVDWILRAHGGARLPAWLREGLGGYLSEDGVHLCNYMAEFRADGPVLLAPREVETILAGPPHAEPMEDRRRYRLAAYSSFLMVWELVEQRGGLIRLRSFLQQVAAGRAPETACRAVYGRGLAELAAALDPRRVGEPVAPAVQARRPHAVPEGWTGSAP
jgi:hypothetical protein